ncbi:MAG: MBL fold metallo-hydrolase [Alphaproteobacteria bacterium]|nr:MBL fold metallo-hydrolase [Alphaproteobacteria bacterium]
MSAFPAIKPTPIHHPWADAPPAGQMIEVAPGVHWLRMALPISLDHINLWLIEDGEEWVIVDTGFGTAETCDVWQAVFEGPAKGKKPGRLICTHHHPDHFGLAGWLERTYSIPCLMSEKEWLVGTLLEKMGDDAFVNGQTAFYRRNGVPDDMCKRMSTVGNAYRTCIFDPPKAFTRLRDNDSIMIGGRSWQVMVLEGHSEALTGLYCPDLRVFIPGDQVLPKITPNISVHWFKDGTEPLSDFLGSLDRIADAMPEDTLVLPSHKLPFYGLHTRVADIQEHHRDRLQDILNALKEGGAQDAWTLVPAIFPRAIGDEHVMFALGESIAHLAYLVTQSRVEMRVTEDRVLYQLKAEQA